MNGWSTLAGAIEKSARQEAELRTPTLHDPATGRFLARDNVGLDYSIGNLLNSTYWLFGVDPFPSIGDVFFLGFYPLVFAAVLTVIRTAAVRVQWARSARSTTAVLTPRRRRPCTPTSACALDP